MGLSAIYILFLVSIQSFVHVFIELFVLAEL